MESGVLFVEVEEGIEREKGGEVSDVVVIVLVLFLKEFGVLLSPFFAGNVAAMDSILSFARATERLLARSKSSTSRELEVPSLQRARERRAFCRRIVFPTSTLIFSSTGSQRPLSRSAPWAPPVLLFFRSDVASAIRETQPYENSSSFDARDYYRRRRSITIRRNGRRPSNRRRRRPFPISLPRSPRASLLLLPFFGGLRTSLYALSEISSSSSAVDWTHRDALAVEYMMLFWVEARDAPKVDDNERKKLVLFFLFFVRSFFSSSLDSSIAQLIHTHTHTHTHTHIKT